MSYTNSSLSTFRRCAREFELGYEQQLEWDAEEDREPLAVGSAWHKAFEYADREGDDVAGYQALQLHAPNRLWNEKLGRLYAAHRWYWKSQPMKVVEPEHTFSVELDGLEIEGQIDGVVELEDGRTGIIERKTSGEDIGAEASYWGRLRLDTQVGLYALAVKPAPSFILYDVVRKPTINPKKLTKADLKRMWAEIHATGSATYFAEAFEVARIQEALDEGRESADLYGARLTADIGDRTDFYFQRREIHRTTDDFELLLGDVRSTISLVEHAREHGFPRNPDSCNAWGKCRFFGLCSNNVHPTGAVPDGFRRREHLHPELA